ncbi:hypothetical protein WA846_33055, partial [Pseudomonas aeruginosa]
MADADRITTSLLDSQAGMLSLVGVPGPWTWPPPAKPKMLVIEDNQPLPPPATPAAPAAPAAPLT